MILGPDRFADLMAQTPDWGTYLDSTQADNWLTSQSVFGGDPTFLSNRLLSAPLAMSAWSTMRLGGSPTLGIQISDGALKRVTEAATAAWDLGNGIGVLANANVGEALRDFVSGKGPLVELSRRLAKTEIGTALTGLVGGIPFIGTYVDAALAVFEVVKRAQAANRAKEQAEAQAQAQLALSGTVSPECSDAAAVALDRTQAQRILSSIPGGDGRPVGSLGELEQAQSNADLTSLFSPTTLPSGRVLGAKGVFGTTDPENPSELQPGDLYVVLDDCTTPGSQGREHYVRTGIVQGNQAPGLGYVFGAGTFLGPMAAVASRVNENYVNSRRGPLSKWSYNVSLKDVGFAGALNRQFGDYVPASRAFGRNLEALVQTAPYCYQIDLDAIEFAWLAYYAGWSKTAARLWQGRWVIPVGAPHWQCLQTLDQARANMEPPPREYGTTRQQEYWLTGVPNKMPGSGFLCGTDQTRERDKKERQRGDWPHEGFHGLRDHATVLQGLGPFQSSERGGKAELAVPETLHGGLTTFNFGDDRILLQGTPNVATCALATRVEIDGVSTVGIGWPRELLARMGKKLKPGSAKGGWGTAIPPLGETATFEVEGGGHGEWGSIVDVAIRPAIRRIRERQRWYLGTLQCAYVSQTAPAFRNAELRSLLEQRRTQLLSNSARNKVVLDDVIDDFGPDSYREALQSSGLSIGPTDLKAQSSASVLDPDAGPSPDADIPGTVGPLGFSDGSTPSGGAGAAVFGAAALLGLLAVSR